MDIFFPSGSRRDKNKQCVWEIKRFLWCDKRGGSYEKCIKKNIHNFLQKSRGFPRWLFINEIKEQWKEKEKDWPYLTCALAPLTGSLGSLRNVVLKNKNKNAPYSI